MNLFTFLGIKWPLESVINCRAQLCHTVPTLARIEGIVQSFSLDPSVEN